MTAPVPPRLLEGVRIIDLTWILVGPGATRILASMGAEVIRIEPTNPARVDLARFVPPFRICQALPKTHMGYPSHSLSASTAVAITSTITRANAVFA
jgi:CoA-transferase family III